MRCSSCSLICHACYCSKAIRFRRKRTPPDSLIHARSFSSASRSPRVFCVCRMGKSQVIFHAAVPRSPLACRVCINSRLISRFFLCSFLMHKSRVFMPPPDTKLSRYALNKVISNDDTCECIFTRVNLRRSQRCSAVKSENQISLMKCLE